MSNEEIMALIIEGKRVLIGSISGHDRRAKMDSLHQQFWNTPLEYQRFSNRILHPPSRGYAHFAVYNEEVMGHEYHVGAGLLTPVMRSLVRL